MKLQQLLLLSFLYLPGLFSLKGQQALDLSEYIREGLENNYSLQIASNTQEIVKNNFTRGNAGFFPVIDLSARQSGTINNTRQTLQDGGGTNNFSGIHNTTTNTGVNLGWNLFSGYRVQTNYKRLEELKNQGELSTRLSIEHFIAQIAQEYYNYIRQEMQLRNLSYSVSLSQERYRIDEERYIIGSGSRLQMLQSRVFLNADSSRLVRQNEVLRSAQIRLNELMGADDFDTLTGVKDTVIIVDKTLTYDELFEITLEQNTGLLMAQSNQIVSEYDKKIIESRTYPYATLNTGYGYTFNHYQSGALSNQQTLGFNYGMTVGINLFDGLNRRREISNAMVEIDNRRLSYNQRLQGVKADLMTIYRTYENNLLLLEMEYENLETARENMEIAFERYRLGNLSGIELREVQISLLDAEERLLLLQFQTKLAEISLKQISGEIIQYI